MTYKITITAHRRDMLEWLPDKEFTFDLRVVDYTGAEDWAKEKAGEIEHESGDRHIEFCTYDIKRPCLLCPSPAPPGSELCDACDNAREAEPTCDACGGPLSEADVEAGEVTCLGCGDGEE